MDDRLRQLLDPVLRDVRATCVVTPRVEPASPWADDPDPDRAGAPFAWVRGTDGRGVGVHHWRHESYLANVLRCSEAVQEAAIEGLWRDGRSSNWPQCPWHPATHPLWLDEAEDWPSWRCPTSARAVAPLGHLGQGSGDPGGQVGLPPS